PDCGVCCCICSIRPTARRASNTHCASATPDATVQTMPTTRVDVRSADRVICFLPPGRIFDWRFASNPSTPETTAVSGEPAAHRLELLLARPTSHSRLAILVALAEAAAFGAELAAALGLTREIALAFVAIVARLRGVALGLTREIALALVAVVARL